MKGGLIVSSRLSLKARLGSVKETLISCSRRTPPPPKAEGNESSRIPGEVKFSTKQVYFAKVRALIGKE